MNIRILHDVYNISKRIKNIDRSYYVVYNTSRQNFEIHSSMQLGSTYCLTLPFKCLDERALKYIRKTQSCNIDEIINQIENENKLLESANKTRVFSNIMDSM